MIISIVGPLAVGKSHFCKWFVERHPEFIHVSIDEARMEAGKEWEAEQKCSIESTFKLGNEVRLQLEERAWEILYNKCSNNEHVLLETSGLSWRVALVLHDPEMTERGIYVVKLLGDRNKCLVRLKNRQKESTKYFPYEFDEETGLHWMIENMHRVPHNLIIDVDSGQEYDVLYKEAEKYIFSAKVQLESEALVSKSNNNLEAKEEKMTLKVTDVRFFNVTSGKGKIKAYAAVTFNDELTVRGYKIVQGDNGLFVGKPSQLSTKDQKWYDNVNYVTDDLQVELHSAILERYKVKNSGSGTRDELDQTQGDDVPF